MSKWIVCKIGSIGRVVTGKTPSTLDKSNFGGPYPFITIPDLNGRVHIESSERTLSIKGAESIKSCLLPPGSVMMSCIATVGKCGITTKPSFTNQQINSVIPKNEFDSRFLYYVFTQISKQIESAGSGGSVYTNLSKKRFSDIEINIPADIREQQAIAHILGTLDDKIDLNRRMNETLEQMARAIFKSWFVDFEPVRAKMSGRWKKGESLPGLPAHLWDLFPDRLVPSELGDIPEGWIIGTIKDVLSELVTGARPKGGAVLSGVPSIGAENIIGLGHYDYSKEKYIPEEFFKQLESRRANVQNGDVLLYKDGAYIGRKTYFDCSFPHKKCAINEHVFILRTKNRWVQRYLFLWLDLPAITQEIVALNSNSAQPGINQAGVNGLPLLQPLDEIVNEFDQIVKPIFDRIFKNCLESLSLSLVRDALLPKLIGEAIQLNDIGELMENRK
ncbi:MAG TPA: restriction endonuclease subunit S [Candidatus Saccharicenans sp.]|nr:restriction endonuclease subunit S [Candidatus Saccharicenans sp.]